MNVSRKNILALSIALALGGCGDSGSSVSSNVTAPTTVASSGVITGFGSIYVNGVRYDTATAEVEFEGKGLMTEADLRLGMRVKMKASRSGDTRVATRIVFDKDLKGPVSLVTPDAINPELGTLAVLGQTVVVDAYTVFDRNVGDVNLDGRTDIRDLEDSSGMVVVEVSGFRTDTGFIATRIERQTSDASGSFGEFEVKGSIAQLNATAGTFLIGGLSISYDALALDADDFADASLVDGLFVEVEGVLQEDGSLAATKIEREDNELDNESEREGEFEIAGVLSAADVQSVPHTITINGVIIPILDASPLLGKEGTKVEIEGEFEAGVLVLDAEGGIKQEQEDVIHLEDRISTLGSGSFTTRLGLTVTPTGTSRVEDELMDGGDQLKPEEFLGRLQVGDFIEARGYPQNDGSVVWTRVKRGDSDELGCELQGPVEAGSIDASNGLLSIQGVMVDTSSIVDVEGFQGITGSGRDIFFAELAAGLIVEAESTDLAADCSSGLLVAGEVAIDADGDTSTSP